MMGRAIAVVVTAAVVLGAVPARAASPTPPIALAYVEGDLAGASPIWSPDGKRRIGLIDYRQRREGNRLVITRAAHFEDGSSDEDEAEVRVGERLESIRGRLVLRDTRGKEIDGACGQLVATEEDRDVAATVPVLD